MQRHHLTKVAVMKGVYGMKSKSCGKHAIKRRRATAPLYVSKNSGSGFFPGALGDLGLQQISNPGKTHMAERIHFTSPWRQRTLQRNGSFGNNDDRRIVTRKSMFDERTHFLDMERAFRYKYCVCTPGDARVPCDPTSVTSHDFDDEYAVVTLRRCVQSIDGFSGNRYGGVKTERVIGGS